ncbi:MAG TPA: enoyl-CoA hydratase/isomerase family protein [Actinospica sp.]|jgi:enoyl-CoA hydratase|nr:enoyl-CoA hydratase/isomerase family protein [Actinospica sp.]
MTAAEDAVLLRIEGRTAYLTLNRPRAINALDHAMGLRMAAALEAWAADPAVAAVVIAGSGERGLCAGGDIRAVRESVGEDGGRAAAEFWRDEYRLNAAIARYPKPYVALMDGIVMGGGVGISAHGSDRIVTERSRIAMPETGIGFVPDVGGTYLLARAPGEFGTHLALTGTAIGAADAIACGLADAYVPSERLAEFGAALAGRDVAEVLPEYAAQPPAGVLAEQREWIDHCYAADTVEEILDRLEGSGVAAAKQTAETIRAKSPTALKITLAAVRRARRLDGLEQVLEQEFRVSVNASLLPDLPEGVRAQIIDKDRRPKWSPPTLAEVAEETVEACFAPTRYGRLFG